MRGSGLQFRNLLKIPGVLHRVLNTDPMLCSGFRMRALFIGFLQYHRLRLCKRVWPGVLAASPRDRDTLGPAAPDISESLISSVVGQKLLAVTGVFLLESSGLGEQDVRSGVSSTACANFELSICPVGSRCAAASSVRDAEL